MIRTPLLFLALFVAAPAAAQNFPVLTGRVVDQADLLTPQQEAELIPRLEALERASSRQLVVATITDLQGYPIEDYGYQLGRHWGIGQRGANNGVILLVAPSEHKVRIEVGYGLEPIITDALSSRIIQDRILPRFRENDYPGGILAGADSIIQQLQAPPEVAEQRALEAGRPTRAEPAWVSTLIGLFLMLFPFLPFVLFWFIWRAISHGMRGSPYRGRRRGNGPVVIWGPGGGSSWGSGISWGGGSSSWGGGGGFSGGGGSFGGGGASGSW